MSKRRKMLGDVDLSGLNGFGGRSLNQIWGVAIGGGVSGVTTIALRHMGGTLGSRPELFGLLAGAASAGIMYSMPSTKKAATGALIGAFLASGIAWLEKTLLGAATVPAAAAQAVAGMGIPQMRALNGLGIPQVRALNGLGMPMISPTPAATGAIPGVAGNQLGNPGASTPPVSLLGPTSPQAAHLLGIGGPSVHGLSAAYGATLLGGGRG